MGVPNADCEGLAGEFRAAMEANPHKPIFSMFYGGRVSEKWKREFEEEGLLCETRVPIFQDSSMAVRVLEVMAWYAERRDRISPEPCF